MIIIFTHIKFQRTLGPGQNARKYVLREYFYVYSKCISILSVYTRGCLSVQLGIISILL